MTPRASRRRSTSALSASTEPAPPRIPAAAWLGLALILLAALWIHHGALRAPFFADDYLFLEQVQGRSLSAALTSPDPLGNYFRPVGRQLWFWSLTHLGGGAPWLFHAKALGLFAIAIVLLFLLIARALGPRAALIAAALLALSSAADVPVLWASGAQDLIAVTLALLALWCFQRGWPRAAAGAFALALLGKETVLFTPVIAVWAARRRGETPAEAALRAWPLALTLLLWGIAYGAMLPQRAAFGGEVRWAPLGALAALVQLARTVTGFESALPGSASAPLGLAAWGPCLLALAAIALPAWSARSTAPGSDPGRALATRDSVIGGLLWALLGALPVAAVASLWSGYYFLFAMCGAALALAAALRAQPAWLAVGVVALLGWGGAHARALPSFARAPGMWTAQSHVNRGYLEHGMGQSTRYLSEIRHARPTLPKHSALYFQGLPGKVGFMTANGPLIRWAYRDESLRGRFLSAFRADQTTRGPCFFFGVAGDSLVEVTGPDSLLRLAASLILSDQPLPAHDLLTLHVLDHSADTGAWYALALASADLGLEERMMLAFQNAHATPVEGPTPETAPAYAAVSQGDTAKALALIERGVKAHALDAGAHALLADILLAHDRSSQTGAIEAYAARLLSPDDPSTWRRWAMVQAVHRRFGHAITSLDRYQQLAGDAAKADLTIRQMRRNLEQALRGEIPVSEGPSATVRAAP